MASAVQYRESYHPYSKAKATKHLTERRRRARINDSLLQLKTMVFPAVQDEFTNSSKMEKADILEMTLKFVKDIQNQCIKGTKPTFNEYNAGFSECLGEVSKFLSSCRAVDLETRMQLLNHLANRCTSRPASPEPVSSTTQNAPRTPHERVPRYHPESNVFVVQSLETPTLRLVSPTQITNPSNVAVPCYSPVTMVSPAPLKIHISNNSSGFLTPPQSPVMTSRAMSPVMTSPAMSPVMTSPAMSPVMTSPAMSPVMMSPAMSPVHQTSFHAYPSLDSKKSQKSVWRPW